MVTTDSGHGLPVYPNVARTLTLTGLDQPWVADITYIRLEMEFVYVAVILDTFSRRVIGCRNRKVRIQRRQKLAAQCDPSHSHRPTTIAQASFSASGKL